MKSSIKLKKKYISLKKDKRLYEMPCPIVGLTGGIATGKSTVSKILKEKNFPIIDADALVKEVYKSKESIEHLKKYYSQVINDEDEINFKLLREYFFQDIQIQNDIESLIYRQLPEIFLNAYKDLGSPKVIIYDVPLLFEKNLAPFIDFKVVVYCPRAKQVERLMARDGIEKDLACKILSKQINIEEKAKLADYVINNSGSAEDLNLKQFLDHFDF
ncbi:dephospho-CoA kinase [Halobacteriovorax vibrionivorans]|uniref:Dephospho-CoA kinase n=1 Tax=Halobacteriovorax vibrionivorans TaxID=2152716 RepID=A0ABY0IIM5_9BACT|nr:MULTISPECIES: dephospho-CoA kinase [Halobacteriovorax]RZF21978.1 dephospho-CoA kinase [Halobacteriovorax vibrionivorans]TGD46467.1 dephospho-CoA kinase [Halobacteriovorax sp. Y22]